MLASSTNQNNTCERRIIVQYNFSNKMKEMAIKLLNIKRKENKKKNEIVLKIRLIYELIVIVNAPCALNAIVLLTNANQTKNNEYRNINKISCKMKRRNT